MIQAGIGYLEKQKILVEWQIFNWKKRFQEKTQYCLLDDESDGIVMTLLIGSDGSMSHVVCKYQDWIFDSNWSCAIDCTRESLDCCVGIEMTDPFADRVYYAGVKKAVVFE